MDRKVNRLSPSVKKQVERGIIILKKGGIVAYPTDTVYGLGASADIDKAVEGIYQVKERPRNMALPLLLADISQMSEVAHLRKELKEVKEERDILKKAVAYFAKDLR